MNFNQVALVTGADRGLGLALTQSLLEQGWTVVAGQFLDWPELEALSVQFPETLHIVPLDVSSDKSVKEAFIRTKTKIDHIDLLIANAALNRSHKVQSIREDQNFDNMVDEINTNSVGNLRLVNAFLPLLDKGETKRLCFVSSEAGSIGASKRTGWFGYCMSKAALNMVVKILFNDLKPQGYGFRLYHPGYLRTYMAGTKNNDAHLEPEEAAKFALDYFLNSNEPTDLALTDWQGTEYPW